MSVFCDTLIELHNKEIDMPADPALKELFTILQQLHPAQQQIAVALIEAVLTSPAPAAESLADAPPTPRELYILALYSDLAAKRAQEPAPAFVHPVMEALNEAADVLAEFSSDALQRDPGDPRQVAARYDEALIHVERARNVARAARLLDI